MEERRPRIKFYVERNGFWTSSAIILMALAAAFRVFAGWGLWNDQQFLIFELALPVGSALLFILLLATLGKLALWTTFLPVLGGVAFFVLKSPAIENQIQMVLCIMLYALVAVLYTCTVFSLVRTKWLLVPLFLLPFLYHVVFIDFPRMQDLANPVSFAGGMRALSVLCTLLSLLCTSFAMKKLVKEPKFREPKAAVPEKKEEQSVQPQPAARPAAQPPVQPAVQKPAEPEPTLEPPPAAEPAPEDEKRESL